MTTKTKPALRRYKHISGVHVTSDFSDENDMRFRYRLEIALKAPSLQGRIACVVMQNPSYADEDVADKSIQFMEKVVFQKNFPGLHQITRLIVVNQFARIQTTGFEDLSRDIGSRNNSVIKAALKKSEVIILAWGVTNKFEERKAFVLGELGKLKGKQLFKTRMHPARGRFDGFIQPFNF